MVSFHEASVYIPPLKIELVFGSAAADTCDMLWRAFSESVWIYHRICIIPFLLSLPCLFFWYYILPLLHPHKTSPFFFIARIPTHSISSISVWHMIAAVKTALIFDNTHFAGCSFCRLAHGTHRDIKTGLCYSRSDINRAIWGGFSWMPNTVATALQTVRHKFGENVSNLCNISQRLGLDGGKWEVFYVSYILHA